MWGYNGSTRKRAIWIKFCVLLSQPLIDFIKIIFTYSQYSFVNYHFLKKKFLTFTASHPQLWSIIIFFASRFLIICYFITFVSIFFLCLLYFCSSFWLFFQVTFISTTSSYFTPWLPLVAALQINAGELISYIISLSVLR